MKPERKVPLVSEVMPEAAEVFAGHTIVRKVGEGAMAQVFEAWDSTGASVALKILRTERLAEPDTLEDFRNEAEATASVKHENVVRVFAWGEEAGRPWIRMELVDGPCLAELLATRGALPWKLAASIAAQLAAALGHAHGAGLVHRDVKPDNVLLYKDGRARLTDFGIVKDVSTLKGYLLPGRRIGTPAYASPEQCLGKRLSHATDIYSLGATLFHMLTGRAPFEGGTRSEMMKRHVRDPIVPPSDLVPSVPRPLSKLVERMMGKRVADRPADMARVVSDLEMIRAGKVPIESTRRR